jgi:hypothetical protein
MATASDGRKEYKMSVLQSSVVDYPKPVLLPEEWTNGKSRRLELREPEVLNKYLEENSFLIPLINEASAKLVEYFGPETPQILQVVYHPDDGSCELFLYVKPDLPVSEAIATLDRFDEDWWLDAMDRSNFQMVIKIGYE